MRARFPFRRFMVAVLLLCAGMQAVSAAPTATVPLQVSSQRTTSMAVWEPEMVRGVVLFSHGDGAWPERYDALLQTWRDAGFAVVAPLHVDSMRHPDRETFSLQQGFGERMADMKAASAYAAARWPGVTMAAAGHSYGTLVSLALGGALPELAPLRDPRVTAVVGYSSPGRIPGLVTPSSYAAVAVPVLLVTGDKDLVPGFVGDPRDHLYPVETAPAGEKYAVVLSGGDHNLIGGQPEALYLRARDIGTAFLKAELLKDAEAARMLSADAAGPADAGRWIRR